MPIRHCPYCARQIDAKARMCEYCGARLVGVNPGGIITKKLSAGAQLLADAVRKEKAKQTTLLILLGCAIVVGSSVGLVLQSGWWGFGTSFVLAALAALWLRGM